MALPYLYIFQRTPLTKIVQHPKKAFAKASCVNTALQVIQHKNIAHKL